MATRLPQSRYHETAAPAVDVGAGRVRSDVAHLYSLKDHGHGVLSEPKIMARRARTPENEACELGVALISWGTCWKSQTH